MRPTSTFSKTVSKMTTSSHVENSKSNLNDLLNKYSRLPLKQQRACAAILGSAVADAASRSFHWVYDRKLLETTIAHNDPAFWPESVSPFYSLPTGRRSCYNDLGQCMLNALDRDNANAYDNDLFKSELMSMFHPSSEYGIAFSLRKEAYDPAKRLEERKPIPGPWQQGAVTFFLEKVLSGNPDTGNPDSKETDGLTSTIPLISALASKDDSSFDNSMKIVADAAKLLAPNPFALKHVIGAMCVLEATICEGKDVLSIQSVIAKILSVIREDSDLINELQQVSDSISAGESHIDAVEKFGKACSNPGSFMGSILEISTSNNFCDSIRSVIKGGGCNCSRANFVGSVLGAAFGINTKDGIPMDWILKTDKGVDTFARALEKISGTSCNFI